MLVSEHQNIFCSKKSLLYWNTNLILRVLELWRQWSLSIFYNVIELVLIPVDLKSKQRISLPLEGLKIIIGLYRDGVPKSTYKLIHKIH